MLATARDWAILVLFVQVFALLLPLLWVAYQVNKGLRPLVAGTRPFLRQVGTYVTMVTTGAKRVTAWIAAPFLWIRATAVGVRSAVDALSRGLGGGR